MKSEAQTLFDSYAYRFKKHVHRMRLAHRVLSALLAAVFAPERWVRVSEEEFLRRNPKHVIGQEATYEINLRSGQVVKFRAVVIDAEKKIYGYRTLQYRYRTDIILRDWHISTLTRLKKWDIPMNEEFSHLLFTVGTEIVAMTREGDTRWTSLLKNNQVIADGGAVAT